MGDGEDDEDPWRYPQKDRTALGWHVSQTALGFLDIVFPGLGYSAQKLAERTIPDPLLKRQIEFYQRLAEGLKDLEGRFEAAAPTRLVESEEFISAIIETTPLAIKTHRETKRAAFANTVLNTAAGFKLDDAVRGRFLATLDQFSVGHIDVLKLLSDPMSRPSVQRAYQSFYMGAPKGLYAEEFATMGLAGDALEFILGDLQTNGFAQGSLNAMMTKQGVGQKMTTALGDAFLRFITQPVPPSN
ncbi:hypothetical protein SAMN02983003_3859 [Devosia enhydra]|uniref:Uncharacterized protein n=1 Tax=Devosia enhydra TaxID=665118 RepID=A0A1K2I2V9_9HYPH|nr:hypothetical protein [Devosia enhydra]SFZ86665.1 hypothetical protein SAMN02983003_3859 [Devosia enhydra]